jgi:hypothetical protein
LPIDRYGNDNQIIDELKRNCLHLSLVQKEKIGFSLRIGNSGRKTDQKQKNGAHTSGVFATI